MTKQAAKQTKTRKSPVASKSKATKRSSAAKPRKAKSKAPGKTESAPNSWQPQVIVFACNWCSYAGADTAGVARLEHDPNFRIIRVMCSGRIQPAFVLRAFEKGADGVLVSGCHFGDCHYIFGNHRAVEQFDKTMNITKMLGVDERRLRLEWISAAEGVRFAQVINEFTSTVRELGPSPIKQAAGAEVSYA